MRLFPRFAAALLAASLSFSAGVARAQETAAPATTLEGALPWAAHRLADLNGDGLTDLLLVGTGGEIRVWRGGGEEGGPGFTGPFGDLVLAHPERSLLFLGRATAGDGPPQLAVLSPNGLAVHEPGPDGGFSGEGRLLAPRAAFRLRTGVPMFSEILRDVNEDGRPDLIVPGSGRTPQYTEACQLWLATGPEAEEAPENGGAPHFRLAAVVPAVLHDSRTTSGEAISDRLVNAYRIPYLDFRDVNGDGRQDLIVENGDRRLFYLQAEDGKLGGEPAAELDLDMFRDTTARAELRPGRVVAGTDDARLRIVDLNGDGIPDYLVSHRRKIWIFKGSRAAPSFTNPAAILKVAEDVSDLLVVQLDGDGRADLLLIRIMFPSVTAIVGGLLGSLELEISATAYAGVADDRTFSEQPTSRGEVTVVVPDVLGILRDPGPLLARWEETTANFSRSAYAFGDLDGDGGSDLAMLSESATEIGVWRLPADAPASRRRSGLGDLFFGGGDHRLDLEEVLDWLADQARERARLLTGGRPADVTIPLRDPTRYELVGFEMARVALGVARQIVLVYKDRRAGALAVIDVSSP